MTGRIPLDELNSDQLDALYARIDSLEEVARGYCLECGRGDCAPTVDDWDRERRRAEQAEAAVERVRAAITTSFITGPDFVQAVRLSAVRAALTEPEEPTS